MLLLAAVCYRGPVCMKTIPGRQPDRHWPSTHANVSGAQTQLVGGPQARQSMIVIVSPEYSAVQHFWLERLEVLCSQCGSCTARA